jgi:hypothetical protein
MGAAAGKHSRNGAARIVLPPLHDAQRVVFDDRSRFRVVFAGRRWGKTELGVDEIIRGACERPGIYWWVGLTWRSASMKRAWRLLKRRFQGIAEIREADREIQLANGSEIWLRTAEAPDSLSGEGVAGVVIDEFTMMAENVWTEHVRATLADVQGWALFTGVPKGKNWGWRAFTKGQNREDGWNSWQLPTSTNPFIRASEVAAAKADLPQRMFEQEWLAAVIADAGGVFRGVLDCATSTRLERGVPGRSYVFGVDFGKAHDFTVITVFDVEAQAMVEMDRFNKIDYVVQRDRLMALYERFKPSLIVAEANSIGVPNIEVLQREGLPIQPFTTTGPSKTLAVDALAGAFERRELSILPDPILVNELQAYEAERLPSGSFRYNAPDGVHDDTVVSTFLAWHAIKGNASGVAGWFQAVERHHAKLAAKEQAVA